MPFFTIGYPDLPTSLTVIEALVAAGADAIEVGIPFSDPLADGPTVQHSSQIALNNGIGVKDCIAAVHTLRERRGKVPMILMGYVYPLLAYRPARHVQDANHTGAHWFIVPNLPAAE